MNTTVYNQFISKLFGGTDFSATSMKIALLDSNYVPAKQHTTFASISADEVSGVGYVAGGKLLTGIVVEELIGQDAYSIKADDASWDPSTITARVVVIYEEISDDLIASFYLDADEISNNGLFEIQWNIDGVLKVSQKV